MGVPEPLRSSRGTPNTQAEDGCASSHAQEMDYARRMSLESLIAVIAASAATLATVVLFVVDARRRDAQAKRDARSRMIAQLMVTMTTAVSRQQRLAWFRLGKTPDLDFALAVPRMLADSSKEDLPVFAWSMGQVQQMRSSSSDKAALAVGINMTMKVAEWHLGETKTEWFALAIKDSPPPAASPVKARVRLRRGLSQSFELFWSGAILLAAYQFLRWSFRKT